MRYQKDIAIAAKASDDDLLRRSAQRNINDLESYYRKISKNARLKPETDRMSVSGFRKVKTADELKNPAKYGIIKTTTAPGRKMANGQRTSPRHYLTEPEVEKLTQEAKALKIPLDALKFNEGNQTSFSEKLGIIYVRGDVLPDVSSVVLRDRMTSKAVLAHEYYGHYLMHPSNFPIGDWRDEFRVSYKAAINAPNLSSLERRDLMLDAYDRAKEAGVPVKYNKKARELIYGYE